MRFIEAEVVEVIEKDNRKIVKLKVNGEELDEDLCPSYNVSTAQGKQFFEKEKKYLAKGATVKVYYSQTISEKSGAIMYNVHIDTKGARLESLFGKEEEAQDF